MSTPPPVPTPEQQSTRDRRTVLRGAAAIGLAGAATPLLAACADDTAVEGAGASSSASSSSSAESSAAASSPAVTSEPLGSKSEIPVGGGKVFKEAKIVVTQPKAGQFKAFSAVCSHNMCVVKDVSGGTINCGCHGSKFKFDTGGVAHGPATAPLDPTQVTMQGDKILGPAV